jgi:AraC-like DNA-binding protein
VKAHLEPIPSAARGSFAVREFLAEKFPLGWHFHPEIELTWVLSSSGRRWVGDHVANYGPGDLVLIGSKVPHYWANDLSGNPADKAHSLVIQFRDDCFGDGFWDLVELQAIGRLLHRARRGLQFHGQTRDRVIGAMRGMIAASGADRLIALLGILDQLAADGGAVPLSSPDFSPILDGMSASRMDAIYAYIAEHYSGDFTHRELAERVGMKPSALSQYFKRNLGTTLSSFLAEYRIGQACRRLIVTDKPVCEIAFECGFDGLSGFNSWFRRLRGMSPSEFRRDQQGGQNIGESDRKTRNRFLR